MGNPTSGASGPLGRLTEDEIKHRLRGFPELAIKAALSLRTGTSSADVESCLYGILIFYLPAGTTLPAEQPSGDTRLREDLGLDSLSVAESMFKIEELFDRRVETDEIAGIVTISDARRMLMEKLETPQTGTTDE